MGNNEQLHALAVAYVMDAQGRGLTRVAWSADKGLAVWDLGMAIIQESGRMDYPIRGSVRRTKRREHATKRLYEGYPPIPGKTLYINEECYV